MDCYNSNFDDGIGLDKARRLIIAAKIPLLSWMLLKLGILNSEQYQWHKDVLEDVGFSKIEKFNSNKEIFRT